MTVLTYHQRPAPRHAETPFRLEWTSSTSGHMTPNEDNRVGSQRAMDHPTQDRRDLNMPSRLPPSSQSSAAQQSRFTQLHNGFNYSMLQYIPNHILYANQGGPGPVNISAGSRITPSVLLDRLNPTSPPSKTAVSGKACINPMEANACMPKMKDQLRHQQPILPPFRYLNCRDFYAFKGSDRRRICAMLIGTNTATMQKEYGFQLCLDQEPLRSFSRELRPTNLFLQEELLRRAILSKSRVLPRPSQWEKEKIIAALQNTYPPQLTHDDIRFLTKQVHAMTEFYRKKKASQIMMDNHVKTIGWSSNRSYLRFYHVLVETSNELEHMESDSFWQDVADRMNNTEWVPTSLVLGGTSDFAESQELPLLFPEPVPVDVLRSKLSHLCATLESSQKGDDDNRIVLPPHLTYFVELLKQREMDIADFKVHVVNGDKGGSEKVVAPIDMESSLPKNTEDTTNTTPMNVSDTRMSKIPSPVLTSVSTSLLSCRPKAIVVPMTNPTVPTVGPGEKSSSAAAAVAATADDVDDIVDLDDDNTYLGWSRLYLNQLEFYNSLENEWLALEEKRLMMLQRDGENTTGNVNVDDTAFTARQQLYDTFCRRKQDSLNALKVRLRETAEYTERCAKRLCVRTSTSQDGVGP